MHTHILTFIIITLRNVIKVICAGQILVEVDLFSIFSEPNAYSMIAGVFGFLFLNYIFTKDGRKNDCCT